MGHISYNYLRYSFLFVTSNHFDVKKFIFSEVAFHAKGFLKDRKTYELFFYTSATLHPSYPILSLFVISLKKSGKKGLNYVIPSIVNRLNGRFTLEREPSVK